MSRNGCISASGIVHHRHGHRESAAPASTIGFLNGAVIVSSRTRPGASC